MRTLTLSGCLLLAGAPLAAQVDIAPRTTTPAAWERFGVRVINQTDTATVLVRVEVPEVIMVLGIAPKPGWSATVAPATDSTAQAITWTGGAVTKGQFDEFTFLGRLQADAQRSDLIFPVRIRRATGSVVEWRRLGAGEPYAAPRVDIVGTVRLTPSGQVAMAGAAIGIALLAVVIAIATRGPRRP